MKERDKEKGGIGRVNGMDKVLSLPGIREALALVDKHALLRATHHTFDCAAKGELGRQPQRLATDQSLGARERLLRNPSVVDSVAEVADQMLEVLAFGAGQKIAELWELSEPVGLRLAFVICMGEGFFQGDRLANWPPFLLVVDTKEPEAIRALCESRKGFSERNAVVTRSEDIREGHIYLDVTYLSYKDLRASYGAVRFCRDKLQIRSQDLREGAPPSADTERALKCVDLQRREGSKQAAKELGFPIYVNDNPGGSYPSFRRYVKLGREIGQRLEELDSFLAHLEDTLSDTEHESQ